MKSVRQVWRHLIGDNLTLEGLKGALIYLGFELTALVLLIVVMGLLGVLISRLF